MMMRVYLNGNGTRRRRSILCGTPCACHAIFWEVARRLWVTFFSKRPLSIWKLVVPYQTNFGMDKKNIQFNIQVVDVRVEIALVPVSLSLSETRHQAFSVRRSKEEIIRVVHRRKPAVNKTWKRDNF